MGENVNTWLLGATFQLIPDRLALKLSGTYELAQGDWLTAPEQGCCRHQCGGQVLRYRKPGQPGLSLGQNTTYTHVDAVFDL